MSRKIGQTRQRLAVMAVEAFAAIGKEARCDPTELRPAQGHWRTSLYADVYRWEGSIELKLSDGSFMRVCLVSWDTMTDCVRHGFTVKQDHKGSGYAAYANQSRTHPVLVRARARGE